MRLAAFQTSCIVVEANVRASSAFMVRLSRSNASLNDSGSLSLGTNAMMVLQLREQTKSASTIWISA